MLTLPPAVRVFIAIEPADMRRSFDTLAMLAEQVIRHGLEIRRSTLCDWVGRVAELLRPLTEAMRQDVLKSKVIHTDDTPVPVLDERIPAGTPEDAAEAKADDVPGRRKTREGRLWTYVGNPEHPHTVFDFTPTRERAGPEAFLKDWSGKLQADAYSGYDAMCKLEHIVEVACWAHARRYFYDAKGTDPPRAQTALAYIHQLYEVERALRCVAIGRKNCLFAGSNEGGRRAAIRYS